jgi:hypothetical protein
VDCDEELDIYPKRNSVVVERMYSKFKLNCGIFCHGSIKC